MEFLLLLIGLGFFVFIIWFVEAAEERVYQRKLNEQREFGYRAVSPPDPIQAKPKHSKKE